MGLDQRDETRVVSHPNGGTALMGANGPIRRAVTVANPFGLHMRPATVFAQTARKFRAAVTVCNGDKKADGKSSLDLILLVALPGAELLLEVDGDDGPDAIGLLADLLADPGDGN